MYRRILGLALVLILLSTITVVSGEELKRTICFSVDVSGESKKLCADVLILVNESKENPMINVTLPIKLEVFNETIARNITIPLVLTYRVESVYLPDEVKSSAAKFVKTASAVTGHSAVSVTNKETSTNQPRVITVTKYKTKTVTVSSTGNSGVSFGTNDLLMILSIVAVLVASVFFVAMKMLRRRREEEREEHYESRSPDLEERFRDYEEALRLAKTALERAEEEIKEKDREIEKLKKSFRFTIECPHCGNRVKPAMLDDNRLICPVCHQELGRIKEDGTLELSLIKKSGKEEGKKKEEKKEEDREKSQGNVKELKLEN